MQPWTACFVLDVLDLSQSLMVDRDTREDQTEEKRNGNSRHWDVKQRCVNEARPV